MNCIAPCLCVPLHMSGLPEIGQGLYETAIILSGSISDAFKNLRNFFSSKENTETEFTFKDVTITPRDRAKSKGAPMPRFTDDTSSTTETASQLKLKESVAKIGRGFFDLLKICGIIGIIAVSGLLILSATELGNSLADAYYNFN